MIIVYLHATHHPRSFSTFSRSPRFQSLMIVIEFPTAPKWMIQNENVSIAVAADGGLRNWNGINN